MSELRKSVKILLFNAKNQLLLIGVDDPETTSLGGVYHGPFWVPVGGKIEEGESILDAAYRELFEETGLQRSDVELGPTVWCGTFDILLAGVPTKIDQVFLVAHTIKEDVHADHIKGREKGVVTALRWFSEEEIKDDAYLIYPVLLKRYISDIFAHKYPKDPLEIDLSKQP